MFPSFIVLQRLFVLPTQHCIKADIQRSQASSLVHVLGSHTSSFLNCRSLTYKVGMIPVLPASPSYCDDTMKS